MCLRDTKAAEDEELTHASQVTRSFGSAVCCSDKLRQDYELMRFNESVVKQTKLLTPKFG